MLDDNEQRFGSISGPKLGSTANCPTQLPLVFYAVSSSGSSDSSNSSGNVIGADGGDDIGSNAAIAAASTTTIRWLDPGGEGGVIQVRQRPWCSLNVRKFTLQHATVLV
jgi:hypothetical protein